MADSTKSCLALFLMGAAFVLPIVAAVIGGLTYDWQTGIILGGVVFVVLFFAAGVLLAMVRDFTWLNWLVISLPILLGIIYVILPADLMPLFPLDDLIAVAASLALSALLMLPQTPKILVNLMGGLQERAEERAVERAEQAGKAPIRRRPPRPPVDDGEIIDDDPRN